MIDIQEIKQRFGIIGNAPVLNRAIEVAVQVAPTDLSVLITGESGVGKEVFPQIIHQFSSRKHGKYIAVNCGAIPEGTIDSELFGHVKGSFTGALNDRKGYFEVADGGTIFLDEVGELPLSTQVRLLRVLEAGEFMKVGSSQVLKTNVRVVAATNLDIPGAISENKFREDLYYRLNTVPVHVPPLRERKDDVVLLFRKFAHDFAERYRMPALRLDDEARGILVSFPWPGNIRQLKNITEQISIIEQAREIDGHKMRGYLPHFHEHQLPALYRQNEENTFASEREILYKVLFDMKKDMSDLKKLVFDLMQNEDSGQIHNENKRIIRKLYKEEENGFEAEAYQPEVTSYPAVPTVQAVKIDKDEEHIEDTEEYVEETLSIEKKEKELIQKALQKYKGKRKYAAKELGISERTLYRKIKEYNIN
ncbi:sigma-54 interaction domain-containing protein [Roseimarinus sediminis]|jgi:transcriptional regulator with PAS, ATPase and Fis domain|uniref:sigma-54 interaction domain-containing protein n=1 Tax=Roseimarinus sediminis TaxID=1610899 RepID=UPI003D1912D7